MVWHALVLFIVKKCLGKNFSGGDGPDVGMPGLLGLVAFRRVRCAELVRRHLLCGHTSLDDRLAAARYLTIGLFMFCPPVRQDPPPGSTRPLGSYSSSGARAGFGTRLASGPRDWKTSLIGGRLRCSTDASKLNDSHQAKTSGFSVPTEGLAGVNYFFRPTSR